MNYSTNLDNFKPVRYLAYLRPTDISNKSYVLVYLIEGVIPGDGYKRVKSLDIVE